MKVICINNSLLYTRGNFDGLTIGKEYTVLSTDSMYYLILDDSGVESEFHSWRFLTLKEQRKIKMKRLPRYEDNL